MDQSAADPELHSQAENRKAGSFPGAAAAHYRRVALVEGPAPHPSLPGLAWFVGSRHPAITGRWYGLASAQEATAHWDTARERQEARDHWCGSERVALAAAARSDSQADVAPEAAADLLGSWGRGDRQGHH